MPKLCLTPELVDALQAPAKGEVWFGDNHLQHFGVRTWAGKNGGGKAYSIRLRDQFDTLVRETYRPEHDWPHYVWMRGREKPLGYFLEYARAWARDRIALNKGDETSEHRRRRKWQQRKRRVLARSIGDAFQAKIDRLRRQSKDHLYVDHIGNMVWGYIPQPVLEATFRNVPIRQLADAISYREISYGNVKVLRGFVGGVFEDAAQAFRPLRHKLESIQRRCARNLEARVEPPYPQILQITRDDLRRFFDELEVTALWRQALAIRLYFATGAKLQPTLRARWSDFVDGDWYPFLPHERALWLESIEQLGSEGERVLQLIEQRHAAERIVSPYLFPSQADVNKPITTVQRHWVRFCEKLGWSGLPLSHVVLRHRARSNPSYHLFFNRAYARFERSDGQRIVSKVAKRRQDKSINAVTYR